MLRPMLVSKIHRATVTAADLHYVGSLTLDAELMRAANLLPGQQVDVVDVTNGARLTTYAIEGDAGTGTVCINGAAARLVHPGDVIIVIGYGLLDETEALHRRPHVVFVDSANRQIETGTDPGHVPPGHGLQRSGLLRPGQEHPQAAGTGKPG